MSHKGDGMIFELMEIMQVVTDDDAISLFFTCEVLLASNFRVQDHFVLN